MAGRGSAPGERRGGRKPGSPNKATVARQQAVANSGLTPLEYMLQVMRDEGAPQPLRLDAAHKAAPFVHPKLASVEVNAKGEALSASISLDGLTPQEVARIYQEMVARPPPAL